jgi:hypothetical protein
MAKETKQCNEAVSILKDALRDNLSPEAVAMLAASIDHEVVKDEKVASEVKWFRDLLVEMVGGEDEVNRVCDDLWA